MDLIQVLSVVNTVCIVYATYIFKKDSNRRQREKTEENEMVQKYMDDVIKTVKYISDEYIEVLKFNGANSELQREFNVQKMKLQNELEKKYENNNYKLNEVDDDSHYRLFVYKVNEPEETERFKMELGRETIYQLVADTTNNKDDKLMDKLIEKENDPNENTTESDTEMNGRS